MIERGDDYAPVAREDILALIDGGGVDCDDAGNPLESEWAVIAEQFAADQPGEPTGGPQHGALQAIAEAARAVALDAIERTCDPAGCEGEHPQVSPGARRSTTVSVRPCSPPSNAVLR